MYLSLFYNHRMGWVRVSKTRPPSGGRVSGGRLVYGSGYVYVYVYVLSSVADGYAASPAIACAGACAIACAIACHGFCSPLQIGQSGSGTLCLRWFVFIAPSRLASRASATSACEWFQLR